MLTHSAFLLCSSLSQIDDGQFYRCFRKDDLFWLTVLGYENGSQNFVTSDELTETPLQGDEIELTAEADGVGNVVGGAGAFELGQEPQPLVRKRLWQLSVTIDSGDFVSDSLLHAHR